MRSPQHRSVVHQPLGHYDHYTQEHTAGIVVQHALGHKRQQQLVELHAVGLIG